MAMLKHITNRLLKKPVKAEFTRIYISFYISFTRSVNAGAYVWIWKLKQFFTYETFQEIIFQLLFVQGHVVNRLPGCNLLAASVRFFSAQEGGELIVEPLNTEDWPAKQIVKIVLEC
ncbi:MAG: hypothetical protein ABIN89_28915 [Chitinophagaceae bacterium]